MEGVLFDFGGTIDTNGVHWSEKFWQYYERFKVPVNKRDFEQAFVATEKELADVPVLKQATMYETLRKQLLMQFKMLGLRARDGIMQTMLDACYADVDATIRRAKPLIEQLSMRYRLGVVSNFYGNLETVCQEFELYRFFNTVVDSVIVGLRKPDPEIWQLALKNMAVMPAHAWVVGDSYERDVVPAKHIGCRTIWLRGQSWTMPSSEEAADYTVKTFEEIKSILL